MFEENKKYETHMKFNTNDLLKMKEKTTVIDSACKSGKIICIRKHNKNVCMW